MKRMLFVWSLALFCASAQAVVTYTWKGGASANWSSADSWTPAAGATHDWPCASGETATFSTSASATLILTEDIEFSYFENYSTAIPQTLSLNGHTLTSLADGGGYAVGGTAPARDFEMPAGTIAFQGPGTADFSNGEKIKMGWCAGESFGGYLFTDGAVFKGAVLAIGWQGPSRIKVENGAVWYNTLDLRTSAGESHYLGSKPYPMLCVTGLNSRIVSPDYNINIAGNQADFYVMDGASVESLDFLIGGNSRSTDVRAHVANGTLLVRGSLSLGTDAYTPGATAKEVPTWPKGHDSKLMISGADAFVAVTNAAQNFCIYEKTGARIDFDIPKVGFTNESGEARAPLRIRNLVRMPRPVVEASGYVADYGTTTVHIACYQWGFGHGGQTIELIRADEDISAICADLIPNTTFTDMPQSLLDAGYTPVLSMAENGKVLQLTFPVLPETLLLNGSATPGTAEGSVVVSASVLYYGPDATRVDTLELTYGTDPLFTDGVTTNLLAGRAPVTGTLPQTLPFTLGGFPQRTLYYAKIRGENELGGEGESSFTFTTGGQAETLYCKAGVDDYWTNAANWSVGSASGATATDYPHAEDTVMFNSSASGTMALRLTEDTTVEGFNPNTMLQRAVTIDGRGHTLYVANQTHAESYYYLQIQGYSNQRDAYIASEDDWKLPSARLEFLNCLFDLRLKDNKSAAFVVGSTGNWAAGALCLSGRLASMDLKCAFWNSGSSVHLLDGAVWRPDSNDISIPNHSAILRGGCLRVEGTGSLLDMPSLNLSFRSDRFGVYVLSGGKISAKNVTIGGNDEAFSTDATAVLSSEDTPLVVRDGTVIAAENFSLGTMNERKQSPRLLLAGASASVSVAGALNIYENLGAKIQFEVPAAGWTNSTGAACAPLSLGSLAYVERTSGYTDYGATSVEISMKDWSKAHAGESLALVSLATADKAALETLKSRCTITDVQAARFAGMSALTVSDDGTELLLHAPPRKGVTVVVR